ncbi:hypothetical protein LO762_15455 [Actinocorallia sp. API 0066]|uniref:hypothetical protein n=1 Tax=Actinocorallia sp. API 0066 TaxID=2896846 RepID=UPI001E34AEA4|nr:hypothetical protein [Actinocorallia sp. API 0066]MCD0450576.1 hypothetical protein [Actinocorallia sp. API 0066]
MSTVPPSFEEFESSVELASGCPSWCGEPHPADEPHFGPVAGLSAGSPGGGSLEVVLECVVGDSGDDAFSLTIETPYWGLPERGPAMLTPAQVVEMRDALDRLLKASGHRAA